MMPKLRMFVRTVLVRNAVCLVWVYDLATQNAGMVIKRWHGYYKRLIFWPIIIMADKINLEFQAFILQRQK